MKNAAIIATLNEVACACAQTEYRAMHWCAHVADPRLRQAIAWHAAFSGNYASELHALVRAFGGRARGRRARVAAVRRTVGTQGALDDLAMLADCERAEERLLAQLREALERALPVSARVLLARQLDAASLRRTELKALRDQWSR